MQVTLKRIDNNFNFEAINEAGNSLAIDASPSLGGNNKGFRPMETLLAGLGGCSGIDIIHILKKQKQEVEHFTIEINAEREKDKEPSLFTNIHIIYYLTGNLDIEKVNRAAALSVNKYCSVVRILEKTAKIKYTVKIN